MEYNVLCTIVWNEVEKYNSFSEGSSDKNASEKRLLRLKDKTDCPEGYCESGYTGLSQLIREVVITKVGINGTGEYQKLGCFSRCDGKGNLMEKDGIINNCPRFYPREPNY